MESDDRGRHDVSAAVAAGRRPLAGTGDRFGMRTSGGGQAARVPQMLMSARKGARAKPGRALVHPERPGDRRADAAVLPDKNEVEQR